MTAEPQVRLAGDPVPLIAKVQMQVTFADGTWAHFETEQPSEAEVKLDRVPYDRLLDQFYPADLAHALAITAGEITGVTLRLKASHGGRVRFSDSQGTER